MIGNSQYHKEHDESFADKVSVLAKYAGVAAIGLGSVSVLGPRLFGTSVARDLSSQQGVLRRVLGDAVGVHDSKILFSDAFNFFSEGVPRVRRVIQRGALADARKNALLDTMRGMVHSDSLEAFDKAKNGIADVFDGFMKDELKSISGKMLSDTNMKRFMETTHGIRFNYMQEGVKPGVLLEQHRQAVKANMERAMELVKDQKITSDKLFIGTHGGNNFKHVVGGLIKTGKEISNAEEGALRLQGLMGGKHKALTINDILTTHKDATVKYLQQTGYHGDAEGLIAKVESGAKQLLMDHDGNFMGDPHVGGQFMDILHNSQSGLAADENGAVYSIVHSRNARRALKDRAKQALQFPLQPIKFNIPMTLGSAFSPDNTPIKSLGLLDRLGELKRMGMAFSENQFGIGIGDDILSVTHAGGSFKVDPVTGGNAKRFLFLNNEGSKVLQEMAVEREHLSPNRMTDLWNQAKDKGIFKTMQDYIFDRPETSRSVVEQLMFTSQPEMFNLNVVDGELKLIPKNMGGSVANRFEGYNPQTMSVTSEQIHPTLIAQFLKEHSGNLPSGMELDLQRRLISSGADLDFDDLSGQVKHLSKIAQNKGMNMPSFLTELMDASDDPKKLTEILSSGRVNVEELTNNTFNPTLSKALSDYVENPGRIFEVSAPAQNRVAFNSPITPPKKHEIFGHNGASQIQKDLQRGLIEEFTRVSGVHEIESRLGGTSLVGALNLLREGDYNPVTHKLAQVLQSGLDISGTELGYLADTAFRYDQALGEDVVRQDVLGQIGAAFGTHRDLSSYFTSKIGALIATERARADIFLTASVVNYQDAAVKSIDRLAKNLNVFEEMKQGWLFRPSMLPQHEEVFSRYTVLPSNTPSMASLLIGNGQNYASAMAEQMHSQLRNGFGMGDFLQGLVLPNKAMGHGSAVFTGISHGAANVLDEAGFGIDPQDLVTFGRAHTALMLKRVVPFMIAVEAYKNLNADLHNKGQNGLDDVSANIYANSRMTTARVRDSLHLTNPMKRFINAVPGLDMYYNPMSEEETSEDLYYGNEKVRMGRGFLIGNRNPAYGNSVEVVRPNLYRRLKSHWTEASNVQLSNPKYSYLPTLTNPLAPLFRLFNPKWQEDLTQKDRPYASPEEMLAYLDDAPQLGYTPGGAHKSVIDYLRGGPKGGTGHGSGPGGAGVGEGMGNGPGHGPGGGVMRGGVDYGYTKNAPYHAYHHNRFAGALHHIVEESMRPSGIYSGILKQIPMFQEEPAFQIQDPSIAFSSRRFFYGVHGGEVFSGLYGEFFRRFVQEDREDLDAFNPLPNRMPGWLPSRFRTGDPYMRTKDGEQLLPGDAYERLNASVRPLKIRGSMVGLSEDEMVQKFLDPVGAAADQASEERMSYGSFAHKRIMRQMRDSGILYGAEIAAYDPKINGSATIETMVRGRSGPEVVEIKTRGAHNVNQDEEKYIDQVMYYMYLTDTKVGHIAHVNRENPDDVRIATYKYDPRRVNAMFERAARARARVQKMIDDGQVSPYETYGLLERIEILAKVAPESKEFRKYVKLAKDTGAFGGMEEKRFKIAQEIAKAKTENFNLYPRRHVPTETRDLVIDAIDSEGDLITSQGMFKLAGVKFDQQAFTYEDPVDVLAKYGIKVGQKAPITLVKGQFDSNLESTTLEAIVGNSNRQLIQSEFAAPDFQDRHPLASHVLDTDGFLSHGMDALLHSDNMVSNKFLRVRSALEQYKRGEVYGTDDYSLKNLKDNYITPTVNSLISKNPIIAAGQSALVASLFFRTTASKTEAAKIAGLLGGSLSLLRSVREEIEGKKWLPKRTRTRNEFDEYYDILNFVKEAIIAQEASKNSGKHKELQANQFDALAKDAEFKSKRTMYGFDEVLGTLDEAIATLPRRHRQIARSVITTASEREKREYYDLLPDSEKRVLGKFLGKSIDDLPKKENLANYFRHHAFPGSDWGGWRRDVDLADIENRATDLEHIKVAKPSRRKIEKSKAYTEGIEVPRMNVRTKVNIQREIEKIVASGEFGNIFVDYQTIPTQKNVVSIKMKMHHDKSRDVEREQRKLIES